MTTNWDEQYATRIQRERNNAIQEILALTQRPEMISFAGGLPAPELFPREQVLEATRRVLEGEQGEPSLQYGTTNGYTPLRQMIAGQMQDLGVPCTVDNVLVTSGSQQGLDLAGKVLVNPGDRIIVEQPTYLGMLQALSMYGAEYVAVATDEQGIVPEALEKALDARPAKLIYMVPNFQNPTGVTTSAGRRAEIVRLADRYSVPIVEDDPYGMLRYEGEPVPPLLAFDAQAAGSHHNGGLEKGNVIRLGTFSKTLCPGFRVAWMVGPAGVIRRLTEAKEDGDLHTSTFAQMVAHEMARDGFLGRHVEALRAVYKERRDLMLGLMEELFPPGVTWTHPEGGLFIWARLPEGIDSTALLREAVEYGVAYVPGAPFFPNGGGENTLRLNFSNARPERIEQGMERLSVVFKKACQRVRA